MTKSGRFFVNERNSQLDIREKGRLFVSSGIGKLRVWRIVLAIMYGILFPPSTFRSRGTRKVEIRHTNFHFSSKKITSKSRKVEVFDLTIVKKLSTFRPKKAKVEKLKSRKVEKSKS